MNIFAVFKDGEYSVSHNGQTYNFDSFLSAKLFIESISFPRFANDNGFAQ